LLFYSAFLSQAILGCMLIAHLSKCWRGTWSEKGWEPQFQATLLINMLI